MRQCAIQYINNQHIKNQSHETHFVHTDNQAITTKVS